MGKLKLYALSCIASRYGDITHKPYIVTAENERDAKEAALASLKQEFPRSDGYSHAVGVMEVPQYVIDSLMNNEVQP